MVAVVLEQRGLDPSFLIGGDLNESGSGARSGDGDLFVFEADESDGSFLLGGPVVGIITNVEVDHVDFYPGGREEIESAFAAFADRCGHVVACGDDEGARVALVDARGDPGDHVRRRTRATTGGVGDGWGLGGARGRVRSATGRATPVRSRSTAPTIC